jgi:hypothetical protein
LIPFQHLFTILYLQAAMAFDPQNRLLSQQQRDTSVGASDWSTQAYMGGYRQQHDLQQHELRAKLQQLSAHPILSRLSLAQQQQFLSHPVSQQQQLLAQLQQETLQLRQEQYREMQLRELKEQQLKAANPMLASSGSRRKSPFDAEDVYGPNMSSMWLQWIVFGGCIVNTTF